VLFSVPDAGIWLPWPSQVIAVISLTSLSRLQLDQQSDYLGIPEKSVQLGSLI
jgi:hypothetical protein